MIFHIIRDTATAGGIHECFDASSLARFEDIPRAFDVGPPYFVSVFSPISAAEWRDDTRRMNDNVRSRGGDYLGDFFQISCIGDHVSYIRMFSCRHVDVKYCQGPIRVLLQQRMSYCTANKAYATRHEY